MEISIDTEHENKLFERKEITAHANYDSKTPSREEVKEALCKKKSLDPEMVEIISIDQAYGMKECGIVAYEYTTKEAKARGAFRMGAKQKGAAGKAGQKEAEAKKPKADKEAAGEKKEKAGNKEDNGEKQEEKK